MLPEDYENVNKLMVAESVDFDSKTDRMAIEALGQIDELVRSASPEGILFDAAHKLRQLIIDSQDKNIRTRLFHKTPTPGRIIEEDVASPHPDFIARRLTTCSLLSESQLMAEGIIDVGWQAELRTIENNPYKYPYYEFKNSDIWIMRSAQWRHSKKQQPSKHFATIYMGAMADKYALRPIISGFNVAKVDNVDRWMLSHSFALKIFEQIHYELTNPERARKIKAQADEIIAQGEMQTSSFDLNDHPIEFMTGLICSLNVALEKLG